MIKFGTDGWRGIISDDFTFQNVRLLAHATAAFVRERGDADKGVVVGYDARFLSQSYAEDFAAILAWQGIKTWLSAKVLPTPALTWAVKDCGAAWGVMITASHNPPEWNGVKLKTSSGGSALPEVVAELEQHVRRLEETGEIYGKPKANPGIQRFHAATDYLQHVRSVLDADLLCRYKGKIVFDAMHGAAKGYIKELADGYQFDLVEIRNDANPSFGGVNPEPVPKNLDALKHAVAQYSADIGLVTDGDGDRIAAMDANGRYINAHQIIALLAKYLVEKKGWRGGIAESLTISELVKKVAEKYNLPVYETPVGFKYITGLMLTEDILIGGEEAGGIGVKNYLPERDGLVIGFLLIEMCAAYGKPIGLLLDELMDEVGEYHYGRVDLHLSEGQKAILLARLKDGGPAMLGRYQITGVRHADGTKLSTDRGWVIFRVSGTEPIVRIYSEMRSEEDLAMMLVSARRFAENQS